eukprot:6213813-Pleurochrysis_carterae.AAC.3
MAGHLNVCVEKDALFLLNIGEHEGEFSLGLARRTFDETPQQLADGGVRDRQPSFKPCMKREGRNRRATPYIEATTKDSFTSIPVCLTAASKRLGVQKPVLTRDCMEYIRDNMESIELEQLEEDGRVESAVPQEASSSDEEAARRAGLRAGRRLVRGAKLIDSSDPDSSDEDKRDMGERGEEVANSSQSQQAR